MPAAMTSVTTPQWFTCFAVTAPVVTGRAFSFLTGAAAIRLPLFTDRHGVSINTELACRFPRSPPCPHLLAAALIQSGVALSTTVLGVYLPWSDRGRIAPVSDTPRMPQTCIVWGRQGKAAGAPWRLCCLSKRWSGCSFDVDQRRRLRSCGCIMSRALTTQGRGLLGTRGHQKFGGLFVSSSGRH